MDVDSILNLIAWFNSLIVLKDVPLPVSNAVPFPDRISIKYQFFLAGFDLYPTLISIYIRVRNGKQERNDFYG